MARILIVDDEPSIVKPVKDELLFEDFDVEVATDGLSALEMVRTFNPDVILLDIMLPGMNGFEVCRHIREDRSDIWIIMLTAREHEVDRVKGLDIGADDYVTKPFLLHELVARIRVGLRRKPSKQVSPIQTFGRIEIDARAHRVFKNGEAVELTPKEYDLLWLFSQRRGEVVTRDEFLDRIWGNDVFVTPRTVDTHVASLRKKIEDNTGIHIQNVRGVGYRLDVE